jgi:WXXGXW repeat (2 copies)
MTMRAITVFSLILLILGALVVPSPASAQIAVGVSIHVGPPALPVYAQPICPAPGYIWTPGYWAYGTEGYYWVPGTWVMAPTPGFLWTPGYWGWVGGAYAWHGGYWGSHVGFYGGINYGFGYGGVGFVGGEWRGGAFHYNTAVANVNTTVIHNTYVNNTVVNNTTVVNHTSFNGGTGGVTATPTAAEQAASKEQHTAPTAMQTQHQQAASTNRAMLASENHGAPAVAATARPGEFKGPGVVAAKPVAANAANSNANKAAANGQNDRPPSARNNENSENAAEKSNTGANGNHANNAEPKPAPAKSNSTPKNTSKKNNSHPQSKPPKEGHSGGRGR